MAAWSPTTGSCSASPTRSACRSSGRVSSRRPCSAPPRWPDSAAASTPRSRRLPGAGSATGCSSRGGTPRRGRRLTPAGATPWRACAAGADPVLIRPAAPADDDAIWRVLEPIIGAGETYVLPRDMSRAAALAYWRSPGHEVFVAEDEGAIVGTYYLRANQPGGGAHVANCGYMTAPDAGGPGAASPPDQQ